MKHVTTFNDFISESAFHAALAKAKDEGLEEFEFNGEKFPVKKDALEETEEISEALNAETDKNIANLSDQALLIMCDTFNDYHKNSKGKMTDNDMAFIMKLFNEKAKRGLK